MATRGRKISFIIWILLISQLGYSRTNLCPMEQASCTQLGMNCTVRRNNACSISSEHVSRNVPVPGPVTSFHVTTNFNANRSELSLLVSWKLPEQSTCKYLSGFEVRISALENQDVVCFAYDLSGGRWPEISPQYQYVHNCASVQEGQYDIEVTSLPRSDFSHVKETAIVRVLGRDNGCNPAEARCWITDIVVYSRPCDKQIRVEFAVAPDEMRISHYVVTLLPKDSFYPFIAGTVNHEPGVRLGGVVLNITDPLPLEGRIITVRPVGSACELNQCLISSTKPFDIVNATENDCLFGYGSIPTDSSDTTRQETTLLIATTDPTEEDCSSSKYEGSVGNTRNIPVLQGIIIGVVLACVLLIGWANYLVWSGCIKPSSETSRKLIYLMYSHDNDYHQRVVDDLIKFLEGSRSCSVIYDRRHPHFQSDDDSWVREAMESCDRIVLVASEGCHRRSAAVERGESFLAAERDYRLADAFIPAYEALRRVRPTDRAEAPLLDKLVGVYLPYTTPEHRVLGVPYLDRKVNFRLMDDIDLVCGRSLGSAGRRFLRRLRGDGRRLDMDIARAARYVRDNPDWFTDVYGCSEPRTGAVHLDITQGDNNATVLSSGYTSSPAGYTPSPAGDGYTRPPAGYTPSPAGYTLSPAGYTPSPAGDGYTRKPAGYTPSLAGYTPSPAGYTPSPDGYTPSPASDGYTQPPAGYTPLPAGYTPSPAGYTPSPAGYTPSLAGYTPSRAEIAPSLTDFTSPSNVYIALGSVNSDRAECTSIQNSV